MRYVDINSLENLDELQERLNLCKDWNCVKEELSNLSQKTCWYCEHYITGSGYAEIDHWRPKCEGQYPWFEFTLRNYIYSCKACNNKKSTHFPLVDEAKKASCEIELSNEEPLLLNPCNKEDVRSVCYDNSGRLFPRTDKIKEKVKITKQILKLDTNERLAKKQRAFNQLDENLKYIKKCKKREFADILIERINKLITYDEGNEFVWSFCMYIESWLRDNEKDLTEIPIREKIKFPQDFCEVYLGVV